MSVPSTRTSKQLGIPSGYRLSSTNTDNIINVSVSHKYKKKIFNLAWAEADLFACISSKIYDNNDLMEYAKICSKLLGVNKDKFDFGSYVKQTDRVNLVIDGRQILIGSNYTYGSYHTGIVCRSCFKDTMKNMTDMDFMKEFNLQINKHSSNEHTWRKNFTIVIEPRNGDIDINSIHIQNRLSPKLLKKISAHVKKCESLIETIEKHKLLMRSILASYTSAVKLCNDAPEFIAYIVNASAYNADGKKCTDISTHDMIAQLRKQ